VILKFIQYIFSQPHSFLYHFNEAVFTIISGVLYL